MAPTLRRAAALVDYAAGNWRVAESGYAGVMTALSLPPRSLGDHLRLWRQRRHLTQLDLALEVEMSQRHLSFIESGRARPSQRAVLRLAEGLDLPLRARNALLLAAGYAPVFGERALDDPALRPAREALERLLTAHEPYPALAIDQRWTLVSANRALLPFLAGVADQRLLEPPVNVLRLSLHPHGLAPMILNLGEWRAHLLERLRRQSLATADPTLEALVTELAGFPAPPQTAPLEDFGGVFIPLHLRTPVGEVTLFSTTTVFGTPTDITLAELMLEAFYPADDTSANRLRQLAATPAAAAP